MSIDDPAGLRSRYSGFESIPVRINVRVGVARLSMGRLSEMKEGDVIRLDRAVGAPFDLKVDDLVLGQVEPVASEEGVAVKLVACAEEDDDSAE